MKGPYLMCHYFLKQVEAKGTIIFVGSGTIGSIFPNMSSYTSSKLAQTKLMEFLHVGMMTRSLFLIWMFSVQLDLDADMPGQKIPISVALLYFLVC